MNTQHQARFYVIRNEKRQFLSHKGSERWTSNFKYAHIFDSSKDPREKWETEKCFGEKVTTENW